MSEKKTYIRFSRFLAKAPVREPLVESLGFDELLVPSTEKGVEVVRGIHPAELPKH